MNQPTPEYAPHTVIFAEVRAQLAQVPFKPFRLVTTSGQSYEVPTADHISTFPLARMISIWGDDETMVHVHALHVAAVEPIRKRRRRAA
jgi:hypothetical protein